MQLVPFPDVRTASVLIRHRVRLQESFTWPFLTVRAKRLVKNVLETG